MNQIVADACLYCGAEIDIEIEVVGEVCDGEAYFERSRRIIGEWKCDRCSQLMCPYCPRKEDKCMDCQGKTI
jgi:hypothetical protein